MVLLEDNVIKLLPKIVKEARGIYEDIISGNYEYNGNEARSEIILCGTGHGKLDYQKYSPELNGRIICADNLLAMAEMIRSGERIDLIYADPPFLSNSTYKSRIYVRGAVGNAKTETLERPAYNDTWNGGIPDYLSMIAPRLMLMKHLLSENGSIYLHIDWHIGHYLKILMDEIFGRGNFVNQIIWKKTNSPKAQSKAFGSQHDMILFYSRGKDFTFHPPKRSRDEKYLRSFRYDDHDGRGPYQTVPLVAAGLQNSNRRRRFEFMGVTAPWLYTLKKLDEFRKDGRISKTRSGYRLKVFLNDLQGPAVSDLWIDGDISPIQGSSTENAGFDTQKPEKLLSRIIETSSNPGDLVADFYSGSGTAAAAAERAGRRWIAVEENRHSCTIIRKRMTKIGSSHEFVSYMDEPICLNEENALLLNTEKIPGLEISDGKKGFLAVRLNVSETAAYWLKNNKPNMPEHGLEIGMIDSWSIDPQYDGQTFRDVYRSFRWGNTSRKRDKQIEQEVEFEVPANGRNARICVKVTDFEGNETFCDFSLSKKKETQDN